jgi:oxalate decarboxylase/phosphoglucose isomerase-like protein (cupin superfamily)
MPIHTPNPARTPGHTSLPPHSHGREDEAFYLLEGKVLARIGETERLLGPGEFGLLPRGVVHALHNPGPEPARFLLLLLPAGSEQCWRDLEAALRDGLPWNPAAIAPLLRRYDIQLAVETGLE